VSELTTIAVMIGAIVILIRVIEKLMDPLLKRNRNPHSDHDILIKLLERQGQMNEKLDQILHQLSR